MTITTSTITGRVPLADNTIRAGSYVTFQLTGIDTDGETIVDEPIIAALDGTGNISVELWPNSRGQQRTKYRLRAYLKSTDGRTFRMVDCGLIEVPTADADIADLIGIRLPSRPVSAIEVQQGESINYALQYLDDNNLPKALTGITTTSWIVLGAGPVVPMTVTVIDDAAGTLEITLSAATTSGLTPGRYMWYVKMVLGARVVIRSGEIIINGVVA